MRKTFDAELIELGAELTEMAGHVQESIDVVTRSLSSGDASAARSVLEQAATLDQAERDIETRCLNLLLRQQPVARDLRTISTALKVVTDLRRIGDQSANIAEIALLLAEQDSRAAVPGDVQLMSLRAGGMVKQAIRAYTGRDEALAREVVALDDEVDSLFLQVKAELTARLTQPGEVSDHAVDLIIIAKYLERIADHGVNIARWAIFCVTGEL